MTREQLIEWAIRHGWVKDKHGHMRKTLKDTNGNDRECRLKLQAISVRREVLVHYDSSPYSPARNEWIRAGGGYYKDAWLTSEDKLSFRKKPKEMGHDVL